MSVIWQLPGDILHSVYSEWLGWKDVSRLDVACVGKSVREVWLTSLTDLRIFNVLDINRFSDVKLSLFYIWLKSRRVFCVEDFPVSVNVLEDLMVGGLDMESYCPALRSIHIRRGSDVEINPDVDEVKDNLSDFLSHCHSLQGATIEMNYNDDRYFNVVLGVLVEKLRENTLIKIALWHSSLLLHESQLLMETLLTKHSCSLRDLSLNAMRLDLFFSSLIKNEVHLRVLVVCVVGDRSQSIASLISYLSSTGDLLESLNVERWLGYYNIDDILVSVATSCPNLIRLEFKGLATCSMEKVRLLYEQCPYLQDVSIRDTIDTISERRNMTMYVKGPNEDWAVCLSHALRRRRRRRRRQYKKVTLILIGCNYHPVGNLKSMLEPYDIHLDIIESSNNSFISLLQDLPHLNSLYLGLLSCQHYIDATLTAIVTQHTKRLTELLMEFDDTDLNSAGPRVYDKRMSELIKACHSLERLKMPCDGLESLVAVSKHSSLRFVDLTITESVTEEILDGLLLDENVQWPSSLVSAIVRLYICYYEFDKDTSHWRKQKLW